MTRRTIILLVLIVIFSTHPVFAVQYISSPPLGKAVSTTVKSCADIKNIQLPLITWGGDIPTVFANGNNVTTQKGSLFDKEGLGVQLKREDVFTRQLEAYLACQSPFLRGTMGMINMAAEVTNKDPRTKLNVVYQLTWSAGGDAMVVKDGIARPEDLKGKTIAVQAYGPHVDYLGKILKDAGLSMKDVTIKWVSDLTGTDNTPMAAFYEKGIAAAMVIIPDALALTSGGNIGTGSEDSVKGAKILLSTKTANRVIADVYAVRSDFLEANRDKVQGFVHALLLAEEEVKNLFKSREARAADYQKMIQSAATVLLDSPQAVKDTEAMYADAEFAGFKGNVKFFTDFKYPRGFDQLTGEIQTAFISLGLMSAKTALIPPALDYRGLQEGLTDISGVELPRFDSAKVATVVTKKQQQGTLSEGALYSFEVYFEPNQNTFTADLYSEAFKKVIDLASTYGGAIITIEGHSDPLGYLKKKKEGESEILLSRVRQSAKNLSLTRANAVRDSLMGFAVKQGVTLDASQFAVVGHGIGKPSSGLCGDDPCAPKTKQEWLNNMRVEFRIIQVEAEESVFNPL
ncbi:MAG: ABC transporter substrate-binding protein [Deltaproteobacteria bacterium]|nr:ABC transporter substrate-binding protein [Deltaproteobacteria bacterium]